MGRGRVGVAEREGRVSLSLSRLVQT